MNERDRLRRLPRALAAALAPLSAAASGTGVRIALVGGVVRDRIRGVEFDRDADLLVEGDASALARQIGDAVRSAEVRIYPRFGTASIEVPGGWRIDLARARRETYRSPGALPDVEAATLEEDLARRDFSVNAMAWELPGARLSRGRFHDPFGGSEDLRAARLRILHGASFRDDPTRILRAVRYANRLSLRIETTTRRRLGEALASGAFDTVSGDRIRKELERTLSERNASGALKRASGLGVLRALVPSWAPTPAILRAVARAEAIGNRILESRGDDPQPAWPWPWLAPLLVSTANLSQAARAELGIRLALAGKPRRIFERFGFGFGRKGSAPTEGSEPPERIAAAALAPAGNARREAVRRLLRPPVRISIGGRDLLEAGIPAGPRIGRALAETVRAREEGRIRSRQELAFAVAVARQPASGDGRR